MPKPIDLEPIKAAARRHIDFAKDAYTATVRNSWARDWLENSPPNTILAIVSELESLREAVARVVDMFRRDEREGYSHSRDRQFALDILAAREEVKRLMAIEINSYRRTESGTSFVVSLSDDQVMQMTADSVMRIIAERVAERYVEEHFVEIAAADWHEKLRRAVDESEVLG